MTLGKHLDIIKDDKIYWSKSSGSEQTKSSNYFSSRFQTDFDVIGFIGRGGFGIVFEAKNKMDECSYAIKRIELTPNDEVSAVRVMHEVKTMASCEHQNIVRYFQSWIEQPPPGWQEDEDAKLLDDDHDFYDDYEGSTDEDITMEHPIKVYLYIQMQLCRKDSLKDWLTQTNRENRFNYIGSIFDQIVDAVDYVHGKGLIHRDLKPSNIFFSQEGQIKIGDFGLVTNVADKSAMAIDGLDQQEGTYFYMSPEQLQGLPYDFKVDIYSMGVILFELLVYFSTEMERCETLKFLRNGDYPADFQHQNPKEYQLLKRMLSANPKARPDIKKLKSCAPKKLESRHCLICAPVHSLSDCERFISMNVFQRHKVVRQLNYCQNCLIRFHKTSQCLLTNQCKHCDRKHHTLLHMLGFQMAQERRRRRQTFKRINGQKIALTFTENC